MHLLAGNALSHLCMQEDWDSGMRRRTPSFICTELSTDREVAALLSTRARSQSCLSCSSLKPERLWKALRQDPPERRFLGALGMF